MNIRELESLFLEYFPTSTATARNLVANEILDRLEKGEQ